MDDADVIEERFWAIAQEIGPLRPAPRAVAPYRASVPEIAFFVVTGPLVAAAVGWSIIAVVLGL